MGLSELIVTLTDIHLICIGLVTPPLMNYNIFLLFVHILSVTYQYLSPLLVSIGVRWLITLMVSLVVGARLRGENGTIIAN